MSYLPLEPAFEGHLQNGPMLAQQSEWIPPPALLAVNSDGFDLNDEIFFNYNANSYTADPEPNPPYTANIDARLLSLLLATAPYNLQLNMTTPDLSLALPMKFDANSHYSHLRRFSIAADQLSRMTLHKLELPTPDAYQVLHDLDALEERTINPRQLFGNSLLGSAAQFAPSPRYILPSSVLSPSLTTFFSKADTFGLLDNPDLSTQLPSSAQAGFSAPQSSLQEVAPNSYVMNDECVSAITYWLNNTADVILDKPEGKAIRNPTGVTKPSPSWKRRNSIQVIPNRGDTSPQRIVPQRRKRRKSVTTSIPEDPQVQPVIPLPDSEMVEHQAPRDEPYNVDAPTLVPPQNDYSQANLASQGVLHDTRSHEALDSLPHDQKVRHGSIAEDDEPKPFPCLECEKQFKRLEHLKRHIRSVHSSIRPFHCKYCEKKFSRLDNLAQHSKTHFKVNANGTTTVIYGNPNPHNRGGRKKSVSSDTGVSAS